MTDLLTPSGWITVPEPRPYSPTAARLAAEHRARIARFWNAKPPKPRPPRPSARTGFCRIYSAPVGPQRPYSTIAAIASLEEIEPVVISLAEILAAVVIVTGVSRHDIESASRNVRAVRARHILGHVAKTLTTASYKQIAAVCGNRDHSSIAHGCGKVASRISYYQADIDAVISRLGAADWLAARRMIEARG